MGSRPSLAFRLSETKTPGGKMRRSILLAALLLLRGGMADAQVADQAGPEGGRTEAPAVGLNPDFTLVNLAGRPVRELRASLAGDRQWGENRLGSNLFRAGERFRLTFPRDHGCEVDIHVGFSQSEEPAEIRNLNTCAVHMLVLTPLGQLIPANPDVLLVNGTGRPIKRIEASLANDNDWGVNRLAGEVMAPGGTLELHLPRGMTCDVDIRVRFADGSSREWRQQDTCALTEYFLR